MTLLGEKPVISATIGQDYKRYFDWLGKNGIATERIRIIEDEWTAGAYITTDLADNQITGFNPGAMRQSSQLDFDALDPGETLVIVSPGNLDDMVNYPQICKERGIDYIFDPGQAIPVLEGKDLVRSIEGAKILIVNDYEQELILNKTGLSKKDLLALPKAAITTLGGEGSRISTAKGEVDVPVISPSEVKDPTGAGDSYRGGLICGLMQGKNILHSAHMGSVCASFAVECYGTQEYRFSTEEFNSRLSLHAGQGWLGSADLLEG